MRCQSVGVSAESLVRHPWLLLFSTKRLSKSVELILGVIDQPSITERELRYLTNTVYNGSLPRAHYFIFDFVYRELGEILGVDASVVRESLRKDEFSYDLFKKYFRSHSLPPVFDRLKSNARRLCGFGFSPDTLLDSMFAILIPSEIVEEMIFEMVANPEFPMTLSLEQEKKILNLFQYKFDGKYVS